MTEKEKEIQRALGTLPKFSVKLVVDLDAANRREALAMSREIVRFLREHYPGINFRKNSMKDKL